MVNLIIVPLTLKEANAFVLLHHRHHKPVQGHRFSIGAASGDGVLHGVCCVGRPVARAISQRDVAEVTRLATDGTENACSLLYGAAARAAREIGFRKIQTYILDSEPGTSLRASGWIPEGKVNGRQWVHTDGKPRRTDQPTVDKVRWAKTFARPELEARW